MDESERFRLAAFGGGAALDAAAQSRIRDAEEIRRMQRYVVGAEWASWEPPAETEADEGAEETATGDGGRVPR